MDSKREFFRKRPFQLFNTTEINEPLLMIYQQLGTVLDENADALVLNKTELNQVVNSVNVKRFPMLYGDHSLYVIFKQEIFLIFERDDLIKQYFRLQNTDEDVLIIEVIRSKD